MRVLGVDPGLRCTGFGCIDANPAGHPLGVVEAGVIRVPQRKPLPFRLAHIHTELTALIKDAQPDLVVVEQVFVHRDRAQTAMQMGHARGVILLCAQQHGVALTDLAPAEIKSSIAGHGRATKEQMMHAVTALLGLTVVPDQPDMADALAIALAGAARAGGMHPH